jgi:hypothetical protein
MTEPIPIGRPARSTALRAYAGEIHADPHVVFGALERALREGSSTAGIAVDRANLFLVVQGGWWYRAEYRVVASDEGSRIEHELVNVAAKAHWAGPLAGRRVLAQSPIAFGGLLTALAAELEH